MNWFKGNIAEAVTLSKAKKAIFVVYIEGTDELSIKLSKLVNDAIIRKYIESENFVAIRIESKSEAYMQFAQIYKLVPLPSIFFIGENGTPLEIVTGITSTLEELEQKIKQVLNKAGIVINQTNINQTQSTTNSNSLLTNESGASGSSRSSNTTATSAFLSGEKASSLPATSSDSEMICEDGGGYRKQKNEDKPEDAKSLTKAEETSSRDEEQRAALQRAKELLEQKKKEKEAEQARLDKERELQRRRQGQDVANLKKWQEEQEVKQIKEDRLREKMAEKEARRRILDQIEQDKADRAKKFGMVGPTPTEEVPSTQNENKPPTIPKAAENGDTARVQFKKPDGDTVINTFNNTITFLELRNYVQVIVLAGSGIKDFALATTFPRREFSSEHYNHTLLELGLAPSSVLLILPLTKPSALPRAIVPSGGSIAMFSSIFWGFVTPILSVLSYVRDLIFHRTGTGANSDDEDNTNVNSGAQKRAYEEKLSDNDAAKRRNLRFANQQSTDPGTSNNKSGAYKRVGNSNIHRLRENKDSDDENNTWNGNSTQQM